MSRSTTTMENPAKYHFEWKAGVGKLQWYNKEKQVTVDIPLPFELYPLDELHTVGGYDSMSKSGFYSNEVKDIVRDELVVRSFKGGEQYRGTYKVNGIVQMPKGAKYAKSVYFSMKEKDGQWVIGHMKLVGSAATAWIEFSQELWKGDKQRPEHGKVVIEAGELVQGQTDYYPPVFEYLEAEPEADEAAKKLDFDLQTYLDAYLKAPKGEPVDPREEAAGEQTDPALAPATPEQQADFEQRKVAQTKRTEPLTANNLGEHFPNEEPISLDDIPF